MSVLVNVHIICVYVCACVCMHSRNSWTAAAMDFDIIFTNDRDKPSFIFYFQAVPGFPLQMCSSRSSRTPLPLHVSLLREARIAALQAGFPIFSRSDRRIPGPPLPPAPAATPFPVTIPSPRSSPRPDSSRLGPRPSQAPSPGC